MTRLLVVVPTTGGPAIVRRLKPRQGLPVSAAFADGDYRPLPWSADYARLSGAGGPIARALGQHAPEPHELRLDRSFDAGRSWEAPVAAAHLLLARGMRLTDDVASADVVLWATGAVDLELAIISGDYAVADKLRLSGPLFDAATSADIIVAPPPGTPDDAVALGAWPNARMVRATSAHDIVAAVAGPPQAPDLVIRQEGGRRIGLIAGIALLVLAIAAGWAAWRYRTTVAAPQSPVAVPGPETPSQPKPPPSVAIDEIRVAAGATCAQALFGSARSERRAVEVIDGRPAPSRSDATLCAIAVGAAVPDAVSVRVTGGLAAASSAPQLEPRGQIFWLKAGERRKIVYEAQAFSKDGVAVGAPMSHELAP